MMKLIEFIEVLRNGELAQLPLYQEGEKLPANATAEQIKAKLDEDEAALNKTLSLINAGIIDLYTRFPVNVKEYIVDLEKGKSRYEMPDDFINVLTAYEEDGSTIRINEDPNDPATIFFPVWNVLQVPTVEEDSNISIVYVAGPKKVELGTRDDKAGNYPNLEEKVPIPMSLYDALTCYVGYKAYISYNTGGEDQRENMERLSRFERACLKAKEEGSVLPTDTLVMEERLHDRGFV